MNFQVQSATTLEASVGKLYGYCNYPSVIRRFKMITLDCKAEQTHKHVVVYTRGNHTSFMPLEEKTNK